MTKPSIGALVNQFEEQGWIERKELAVDRRAASIKITAKGRKVITQFHAEMQKVLERFLGQDVVVRADGELGWLLDVLQERRSEAHVEWALRKSAARDQADGSSAP